MPGFSIVMPCFNAADTLPETLASIRAQTLTDWELVCLDDGSTDTTRDLIAAAAQADPRIRLAANIGKGPSRARNLGALEMSRGQIIAFCDADDLWTPGKLADLAIGFADPAVDGIYGKIAFFDTDPAAARVFSTVQDRPLSIETLLGENPVCTMSNIAVRRAVFERSRGFDETMVHNEDLDWLIRLAGAGVRLIGRDRLHVHYRASPHGLSADLPRMAAGRARAVASAARFGVVPTPAADAVHLRYLARRALRLGQGRVLPLRYALAGLRRSPAGFLAPARRGVPTLVAACCAPFMPRPLARALFSR